MLYSSIVIGERPSVLDICLQALNLQGISNFFYFIPVSPFGDNANLWFMTIIMLCYLFLPVIQFVFKKSTSLWLIFVMFIFSIVLEIIGIGFLYIFTFLIGYYVGKIEYKRPINIKNILTVGVFCFVLWVIRIFARPIIDGTVIYNKVIANSSLDILAFWVFILFLYLYPKMQKMFDFIAQSRSFRWIDALSIYIYIVHRLFYAGFWKVTFITSNLLLQTLLVIIFSIVFAMILKFVTEKLQKIIFHSNFRKTKDV